MLSQQAPHQTLSQPKSRHNYDQSPPLCHPLPPPPYLLPFLQQLLVRQDPSGHEHIQGYTGNTMRPADDQPELKAMGDTSLYKDKVDRAGEAVKDLVTGSGGSSSVAHQTADNRPDGIEVRSGGGRRGGGEAGGSQRLSMPTVCNRLPLQRHPSHSYSCHTL